MPSYCIPQLTQDNLKAALNTCCAQPSENHTPVLKPQTVEGSGGRVLCGNCRETKDTLSYTDINTSSSTRKVHRLNKQPDRPSPGKNMTSVCEETWLCAGGMGTQKQLTNVFSGRWSVWSTASLTCVLGPVWGVWDPFSASLFPFQRHHFTLPLNAPLILPLPKFFVLFHTED